MISFEIVFQWILEFLTTEHIHFKYVDQVFFTIYLVELTLNSVKFLRILLNSLEDFSIFFNSFFSILIKI